jgi:hypothetical protein
MEIDLYGQSYTEESAELEGTMLFGLFRNQDVKYKVNGTLDYNGHINEIDS